MNKLPFKLIDLTHALNYETRNWDGGCGFKHTLELDYDPEVEYAFRTHTIHMNEGIGTHMDAPAHCIKGAQCIADLDINNFLAPCIVIDVSSKADAHYTVSLDDIHTFEENHGQIPSGSFAIMHTGWAKFWDTPEKYWNNYMYPNVAKEAAYKLLERGIVGLGIDTLSPDRPSEGFPVHHIILGAGKYIVENITNAHLLPPMGSYTLALPMKIQDGTEAPIRLVGLLPKT